MAVRQFVPFASSGLVSSITTANMGMATLAGSDLLLLVANDGYPAQYISGVSDNKGNTGVALLSSPVVFGGLNLSAYLAANITHYGSGHNFTFTLGGGNEEMSGFVLEITGRATNPVGPIASYTDNTNYVQTHGTGGYPAASLTLGASQAGADLINFNVVRDAGSCTLSAGSGWTLPSGGNNTAGGSTSIPSMIQYIQNASAGSYTGAFGSQNYDTSGGLLIALLLAPTVSTSAAARAMMLFAEDDD